MSLASPRPTRRHPKSEPDVPPLENGDHLTREEIERRWHALPEVENAELIEGVVYLPSPAGYRRHAWPHPPVSGGLDRDIEVNAGVDGGDNASMRLDLDNMPQPHRFLAVLPEFGARIRIGADDEVEGSPELVAGVASGGAPFDRNAKLTVHRRGEMLAYRVWRTRDGAIGWFVLRGGHYEPLAPGPHGVLRSTVFLGLWLDPWALNRGDRTGVARVFQQGLASAAHAAYAARLEAQAAQGERAG